MTRTLPNLKSMPIALLLTLVMATTLVAQAPAPRPPRGPGFAMAEAEFLLERMALELDLSAAQIAEIDELVEAHRIETAGLRTEADTARTEVGELVEGGLFDEAAVRAAAERAAALHVELTVARARLKSEIHNVLTPEQQERAAEIQAQRSEQRERFRDRRGLHRGRAPRARG